MSARVAALLAFAAISIASAVVRTAAVVAPDGSLARAQRRLFVAMASDPALVRVSEERFRGHAAATLLHVIPGAIFLALAPLQFSERFRSRHLRAHRRIGRMLLALAAVSAAGGLFFGAVIPLTGFGERSSTAFFGALFLVAVARGFVAARRRDIDRHRRWMTRAFAIALGVSTIRVIAAVLQLFVRTTPERTVTISFWLGWGVTLAAAELWLRSRSGRTYRSADPDTYSASA